MGTFPRPEDVMTILEASNGYPTHRLISRHRPPTPTSDTDTARTPLLVHDIFRAAVSYRVKCRHLRVSIKTRVVGKSNALPLIANVIVVLRDLSDIATREQPTFRLLLGADAFGVARQSDITRMDSDEKWEKSHMSTDFSHAWSVQNKLRSFYDCELPEGRAHMSVRTWHIQQLRRPNIGYAG